METTTERRILDGRWALIEAVGGGGMSQVYRGVDLEQEHGEVAVKVLPAPRQQDKKADGHVWNRPNRRAPVLKCLCAGLR